MLRSRPQLKGALLMLLVIALLLVGLWVWIGVRTGMWTFMEYGRNLWLVENTPVLRAFWGGDINAGDSVEEVIDNWPPTKVDRFGPWAHLEWYPGVFSDDHLSDDFLSYIGVCAFAKNGVLIYASSYSDDGLNNRVFFNSETTNDWAEYETALKAHSNDLRSEYALVATKIPILHEFYEGKIDIKEGDMVEPLIKSWRPSMVTRFGRWTVLRWFPENLPAGAVRLAGMRVIAKNGVVVFMNTFADDGHYTVFVDNETPRDKADFDAAYLKYDESLQATNESSLNQRATNETSSPARSIK
jgi:hypothetical protein